MKKFWKRAGIILGALAGLIVIGMVVIYVKTETRLNRINDVSDEPVAIPSDPDSIECGKHIFQFRGCEACHGGGGYLDLLASDQTFDSHLSLPSHAERVPHMEGNIYLDEPAIGRVVASNLTPGVGGVGSEYTDQAWARAIRHGIRPDGTPLLFMPSTEFYFLSDEDLGAVVAYIESAPPVDNELPPARFHGPGESS